MTVMKITLVFLFANVLIGTCFEKVHGADAESPDQRLSLRGSSVDNRKENQEKEQDGQRILSNDIKKVDGNNSKTSILNYLENSSFGMIEQEYKKTEPNNGKDDEQQHLVSGPFLGPVLPLLEDLHDALQQQQQGKEQEKSSLTRKNNSTTEEGTDNNDVVPATSSLSSSYKIIGGRDINRWETFSYFAVLLMWDINEWRWIGCGATVISDCHVITAAHCVTNPNTPVSGIFINPIKPFHDNAGEPFHFSFHDSIAVHPRFNSKTNEADIAIIKLSTCVDSTAFPTAYPANANYNIDNGMMVDVMGFGLRNDRDKFGDTTTLQHVTLPYITSDTCSGKDYYNNRDVRDDMVCAGYKRGGVDACEGDSGSGMIRKETNNNQQQYALLGVVSWGSGCGPARKPAVYISIPYYYDWIHGEVCNRGGNRLPSWCYR